MIRWHSSSVPRRRRASESFACASRAAVCVAPTCIWPRATSCRTVATSFPVTRSSASSTSWVSAALASALRRAGGIPWLRTDVVSAASAAGATRTLHRPALHGMGRRRRVRGVRRRRRAVCIRASPRPSPTRKRRRSCAPESSAFARSGAPHCRRRAVGHLRVRRVGTSRGSGRAAEGDGSRDDVIGRRATWPRELGVAPAGDTLDAPPEPLDSGDHLRSGRRDRPDRFAASTAAARSQSRDPPQRHPGRCGTPTTCFTSGSSAV